MSSLRRQLYKVEARGKRDGATISHFGQIMKIIPCFKYLTLSVFRVKLHVLTCIEGSLIGAGSGNSARRRCGRTCTGRSCTRTSPSRKEKHKQDQIKWEKRETPQGRLDIQELRELLRCIGAPAPSFRRQDPVGKFCFHLVHSKRPVFPFNQNH